MKKYNREWKQTDPSTNQYGRQLHKLLFEFKEDGKETTIIDLNDYESKEIEHCINAYGYTLVSGELKNPKLNNLIETSNGFDEVNWIIAECLFETETPSNKKTFNHTEGEWDLEFSLDSSIFIKSGEKYIACIQEDEDEGRTIEGEYNAKAIVAAVNSTYGKNINPLIVPDMLKMLEELTHILAHIEGDTKGNKIKTDIVKHCPNVTESLNNANQLLWYKVKVNQ